MAMDGNLRSAKAAVKRAQYDEKKLRHRVSHGTRQKFDELMAWNGIEEINEAVKNLILKAHALGPTLSFQAMESPRHKVQISENVARMFRNESLAELKRDTGDESIAPPAQEAYFKHLRKAPTKSGRSRTQKLKQTKPTLPILRSE